MRVIQIIACLVATAVAVAIPPTANAGEVARDEPETKQDSAIPFCKCAGQEIMCCSDSGSIS
ncbi:hypothetical protein GGS24DRAFT_495709 [Hypoxylon argillaceum]|nr:hypothetical protein GGS24DRAFT_495709 [Hypoxylon argillaceum]KAI1154949.1 hypothetical protein F4825DRAFT_448021 [Nemania diffusa]